jgi:hypothetical protein
VVSLHKRGRPQFALPQSVFLFSLLITLLATIVIFLISKFRRILNVVFFLHRSFKRPLKMEQTECSETSGQKIPTPGNQPKVEGTLYAGT